MKLKLTLTAVILSLGALPGFGGESAVVTNRTVGLAYIVERINSNWIGHAMSDIIGTGKVVSVIILKNNTQMAHVGHAEGIRRAIEANPTLEDRPNEIAAPHPFSDAADSQFFLDSVLILEDGMIIRVERSRSWGRLTTERGRAYFRIQDKRPNNGVQAIGDKSPQPDP